MEPAEASAQRIGEALRESDRALVSELLLPLHAAEVADLLESLPLSERELLWSHIEQDDRGEILAELEDVVREDIPTSNCYEALRDYSVKK